jgi:hypothetical protein
LAAAVAAHDDREACVGMRGITGDERTEHGAAGARAGAAAARVVVERVQRAAVGRGERSVVRRVGARLDQRLADAGATPAIGDIVFIGSP